MIFTLIAERYERRSLGIMVFSQWEHIFARSMATAAAIERFASDSFSPTARRTDSAS